MNRWICPNCHDPHASWGSLSIREVAQNYPELTYPADAWACECWTCWTVTFRRD